MEFRPRAPRTFWPAKREMRILDENGAVCSALLIIRCICNSIFRPPLSLASLFGWRKDEKLRGTMAMANFIIRIDNDRTFGERNISANKLQCQLLCARFTLLLSVRVLVQIGGTLFLTPRPSPAEHRLFSPTIISG